MSHPDGGHGNNFKPKHSFSQVLKFIGNKLEFISTTGEKLIASPGKTQDGLYTTIVFTGENCRHGNVCKACWGYRSNCSRTRIGHCTEALDNIM